MFEQTVFVDEIDNEDIENYIIKAFTDRDDIARISSLYSVKIADPNGSIYTIETMYEISFFLGKYQIAVRSHLLPTKNGVISKDDGKYYNDKSFYTLDDEDDMNSLKEAIRVYNANTIGFLQKLSSGKITLTMREYSVDDLIKLYEKEEN